MPDAVRHEYLTPAEAAAVLGVPVLKVRRWEDQGRLEAGRTPGGHRRYRADSARALRAELDEEAEAELTSADVAGILGVTLSTVTERARKGKIAGIQTPAGWRFRVSGIGTGARPAGSAP